MSGSAIQAYDFNGHEVRTVTPPGGETRWVADDVCGVLDIKDTYQAVFGRADRPGSGLDEDERGYDSVITPGGSQVMVTITESGLYSLILTSRKPQAKAFKKWVTSEVLPAIRKTGRYSVEPAPATLSHPAIAELSSRIDGLHLAIAKLAEQPQPARRRTDRRDDAIPHGYSRMVEWAERHGVTLAGHEKRDEAKRAIDIAHDMGLPPIKIKLSGENFTRYAYHHQTLSVWIKGYCTRHRIGIPRMLPFDESA